jgi:hypothetical protein
VFAGAQTVTVVTTTTTQDRLGNTSETTVQMPWDGVLVAPRYAVESSDPRVAPVVVGKTVYGPATVTIGADDMLLIDGVEWQVDGLPGEWPWPAGGMAGLEVPVKRAGGVDGE